MKKVVFATIFAAALSLTSFATSSISSIINPYLVNKLWTPPTETFSFNETFDFTGVYFNPCNGEGVLFTGSFHETYHGVINKNKVQYKSHFNSQGVSGVGFTTGTKYRLVSVINAISSSSVEGCIAKSSFRETYNFVSSGSEENLIGKLIVSYIYNTCTNELEVKREELSLECK